VLLWANLRGVEASGQVVDGRPASILQHAEEGEHSNDLLVASSRCPGRHGRDSTPRASALARMFPARRSSGQAI
jgi:hypothetical protein